MSFQLPSYFEGDADLVPLRDPDAPEQPEEENFSRASLGKYNLVPNKILSIYSFKKH